MRGWGQHLTSKIGEIVACTWSKWTRENPGGYVQVINAQSGIGETHRGVLYTVKFWTALLDLVQAIIRSRICLGGGGVVSNLDRFKFCI